MDKENDDDDDDDEEERLAWRRRPADDTKDPRAVFVVHDVDADDDERPLNGFATEVAGEKASATSGDQGLLNNSRERVIFIM